MTEQTSPETVATVEPTEAQIAANAATRRKKMTMAIGAFLLMGIAFAIYYTFVARFNESTDNAYVGGNVVAINAQTSGTVEAVLAEENQEVKAGQGFTACEA